MNAYARSISPVLHRPVEPAQFTSWSFTQNLKHHELLGSMGTVGDCLDNAPMESFWGSMQIELLHRKKWLTYVELATAMADYIVNIYNPMRRHSSLDYLTPDEFEALNGLAEWPTHPVFECTQRTRMLFVVEISSGDLRQPTSGRHDPMHGRFYGQLRAALAGLMMLGAAFSASVVAFPVLSAAATATTLGLTSSITPSPAISLYGTPVTFTATVAGSDGGGTVTFWYDSSVDEPDGDPYDGPVCSDVALGPDNQATCTTPLSLGEVYSGSVVSIYASYSGDANSAPVDLGSSPTLSVTITSETPVVTVTSTENPAPLGGVVTYQATVSPSNGAGTITFTDGGAAVAGCQGLAQDSSGQATCTTTLSGAGHHAIVANYAGDSRLFYGANSSTLDQAVLATTTVGLTSSINPSSPGAPVLYTATVSGSDDGGTVSFADSGTPISGCQAAALNASGQATCATTPAGDGNHFVIASYSGDSNSSSSSSPALSQQVVTKYAVTATVGVGSYPAAVAVDPNTDTVYVPNSGDSTMSVIDGATNTVRATVAVGSYPSAVAVDPNTDIVYVPNAGDSTVSVIDGVTDTVTATIQNVGLHPDAVAVDPTTSTVYVANAGNNSVSVIDEATDVVTATIYVGAYPDGVAVDPTTGTLFVANQQSDTVSVIDEATNTVTATVGVGSYPLSVAVDPTTGTAFVTNETDSTLSVISEATNSVTATVGAGYFPQSVAVDPIKNTVFVADFNGTASVIDGATDAIATVGVGGNPDAVAVDSTTDTAYVVSYGGPVSVISAHTPIALDQGSPTSGSAVTGTAFSDQLTVSNEAGGGALTWTTTSAPSPVTVNSGGSVSAPSNTAPNTYTVSGNVSDSLGDSGNWSFTLNVVVQCQPGYYSATGGAPCTLAPPNTYVPTTGATAPTPCPTGTNNPNSGSTSIAACVSVSAPTISGFTPPSGPPGTVVTITGTHLDAATTVNFNGVKGTIASDTSTKITVRAPAGASTGYIKVKTPFGSTTSATVFTYTGPTITGFTPSSGGSGTQVTITGTLLALPTEVDFNGKAGRILCGVPIPCTNKQIVVEPPVGVTTGPIKVIAASGSVISVPNFFSTGPTITGFSPSSGPPGTVVTITGTNLALPAGSGTSSGVTFNGRPATLVNDTNTIITVKVPTGATTGHIVIANNGSGASAASATTFTDAGPTITGFSPSWGPPGTVVTITGTNLSPAQVAVNGRPAIVVSDTTGTVTVKVPTAATTGYITVTNPFGSATSASEFAVE